jgi:transcriptional regulator with GAF, ATPase, and Fis domain
VASRVVGFAGTSFAKAGSMNGLVPNSSSNANGSKLFDSRISHLKILALSLLREIASAERVSETQRSDTIDLQAEVRRFEVELIRSALIQTGGRQRQAARLLGTKITTLNTKIKRYNIKIPTD